MDITNGLTLAQAIKDKNTPFRQYLEETFPFPQTLRREFAEGAPELRVDSSGAPASTIGTAFDLLVRFLLDPKDVPQSARILFSEEPNYTAVVDELAALAGRALREGGAQPVEGARAVWALALCVEAHRAGPAFAPLVPSLVYADRFTVQEMLAQGSADALQELLALRSLADTELVPQLASPVFLGPEFDRSKRTPGRDRRLIAAEADLIAGGVLVDVKTRLGTKNKAGVRTDGLAATDLYQLLAYALLDASDAYGITALGVYSARYGRLVTWPLEYVTSTMAGRAVDFSAERRRVDAMLTS